MKTYRKHMQWALVRCPRSVALAATSAKDWDVRLGCVLTRAGAKMTYRGGGWYVISGYHYAGKDVDIALCQMSTAARKLAWSKPCNEPAEIEF